MLLYEVLPAMGLAAFVTATVLVLFGKKHAAWGATLGLIAGVVLGLSLTEIIRLTKSDDLAWADLPWVSRGFVFPYCADGDIKRFSVELAAVVRRGGAVAGARRSQAGVEADGGLVAACRAGHQHRMGRHSLAKSQGY